MWIAAAYLEPADRRIYKLQSDRTHLHALIYDVWIGWNPTPEGRLPGALIRRRMCLLAQKRSLSCPEIN